MEVLIRINREQCGFLYTRNTIGMRYSVARKKNSGEKRAYAIYRMGIAIDRMLAADGEVGKRHLTKWARAWGRASNAQMPENSTLRQRLRRRPPV